MKKRGKIRIGIGCVLAVLQLLSLLGNMKAGIRIGKDVTDFESFLFAATNVLGYFLIGIIGVLLIVWGICAYNKKPKRPAQKKEREDYWTSLPIDIVGQESGVSVDTVSDGQSLQEDDVMRFCIDCGAALDQRTKTCVGCGKSYDNAPASDTAFAVGGNVTADKSQKGLNTALAAVVCAALLVVTMGGVCVVRHRQMQEMGNALVVIQQQLDDQNEQLVQAQDIIVEQDEYIAKLEKECKLADTRYEYVLEDNQELNNKISQYAQYAELAEFVNKHVVFIEDDGTEQYHTFDCSRFEGRSFLVYNKGAARVLGYTPCPRCH